MENGGKERLQSREKDDKREKRTMGRTLDSKGGINMRESKEQRREKRACIVQELFKLYDRERELERELEEEITELLKSIDKEDYIIQFVGTTLEDDGIEYWTQRGKEVCVRVDGSIEVRGRNGKPILRV